MTPPILQQPLDEHLSEAAFAEVVDGLRQRPEHAGELVALLDERHRIYRERSGAQVVRMRGYILAAFEQTGLPEAALPFVCEELQTGRRAYLVAAAAKALRGSARPNPDLTPFLLKAIQNIAPSDDTLSFDGYFSASPPENPTTAVTELLRSLAWMGPAARSAMPFLEEMLDEGARRFPPSVLDTVRALRDLLAKAPPRPSCCSMVSLEPAPKSTRSGTVDQVVFEDQDGRRLRWSEFFTGKPCAAVFFYTRCDNPEKCSLSITQLARLQQAILDCGLGGQVRTAAITYDPAFDLPPRLRAYGQNRGVRFDEDNRMLRAVEGFQELEQYFQLGVNYVGTIVNRHQIEVYLLDRGGRVHDSLTRLQWDPKDVLNKLTAIPAV
jgi:cytochrome oxidase Cu insertion factor (SCO1/SenC/PrrC family)